MKGEVDLKVELTNEMLLNIVKNAVNKIDTETLDNVVISAETRDGIAELSFSIVTLMPESDGSDDFHMETGNTIDVIID